MSWKECTPSGFDIIEHRLVVAWRWKYRHFQSMIKDNVKMKKLLPEYYPCRMRLPAGDINKDKRFPSASHV